MVYLLVYSKSFGERQEVKDYFSSCSVVNRWRYDLPNSIYLASDEPASILGRYIRERSPDARFILTEISNNREGWLPKETWGFIHDNS